MFMWNVPCHPWRIKEVYRSQSACMVSACSCNQVCVCDLQDVLPELYCGHDAFLFSSRYEAWGMPVLEAMAAGLAVVATACLGVNTFARHGINALLAPPQVRNSTASNNAISANARCQHMHCHMLAACLYTNTIGPGPEQDTCQESLMCADRYCHLPEPGTTQTADTNVKWHLTSNFHSCDAKKCLMVSMFAIQDITGLVRNLYLVLTNEPVRLQLQLNARQTAEQFTPVAIAERWVLGGAHRHCFHC